MRKVGRKPGRPVAGRLVKAPKKGAVIVVEFPDGVHEYVTTPVKRVLRLADEGSAEVYYIQTANSSYRMEVNGELSDVSEEAARSGA